MNISSSQMTDIIPLTSTEMRYVATVSKYPVMQNHLRHLRNADTTMSQFRMSMKAAAAILGTAATKQLHTDDGMVQTPLGENAPAKILSDGGPVIVSILRAATIMHDTIIDLVGDCSGGHIGLTRNEATLEPDVYLNKQAPNIANRQVILTDPMLATGNSACKALSLLKDMGVTNIVCVFLIAAPFGIRRLHHEHPNTQLFIGNIDEGLNEKGYIIPGLGDAGDRIYGTK